MVKEKALSPIWIGESITTEPRMQGGQGSNPYNVISMCSTAGSNADTSSNDGPGVNHGFG